MPVEDDVADADLGYIHLFNLPSCFQLVHLLVLPCCLPLTSDFHRLDTHLPSASAVCILSTLVNIYDKYPQRASFLAPSRKGYA